MAHDHDEAVKGLRAIADGKQSPLVFSADGPVGNGPVWVLAGFGAQHRKMGKNLYLRDEVFAEWINKVDSLIQDERGYSILELILDDSVDYTEETCQYPIEVVQLVIFGIQIALGELLRHHGAKPAAVIGQSLGEAAAAYFAGGLSLADATRTICARSHLMGEGEQMLFGEYIRLMALVEYSADEIKTVFSDFPDLEVCVYAAPNQTVIGGPPAQVDAIIERAEAEGKFARKFQTKGASHTTQMDPLLGELAAELQGIEPHPLHIGYFSTVHEGGYIRPGGEPIHGVDYWKKGLRHSVYFTQGIRNAVENGHTTFLELAPNPVALMQVGLTTAAAGLHDGQLIATLAKKQDEVESMVAAMAQLYVHGHDLDVRSLFGPGDYADIPPTRFKRKEHWLNAQFSADGSSMIPGSHVATPDGRHVWEYAAQGQTDLAALVKAAAAQVLPDATLTASEQRAVPGDGARLVTTLTRHPGGASVQVHARIDESFTLVYDAVVARAGTAAALPAAVATGVAVAEQVSAAAIPAEPEDDAEILQDNLTAGAGLAAGFAKWSPDSGETVHDRLAAIVGGAMGYEPEDLPWEVPLIELGLDSLMAVRIKNRVEYDFDLPPIQLTAVRDANLYAVDRHRIRHQHLGADHRCADPAGRDPVRPRQRSASARNRSPHRSGSGRRQQDRGNDRGREHRSGHCRRDLQPRDAREGASGGDHGSRDPSLRRGRGRRRFLGRARSEQGRDPGWHAVVAGPCIRDHADSKRVPAAAAGRLFVRPRRPVQGRHPHADRDRSAGGDLRRVRVLAWRQHRQRPQDRHHRCAGAAGGDEVKFVLWKDAKGEWRWTLRAKNGKIVADSAEGYKSRRHAVTMCRKINAEIPRETA